jgi:NAD(P)-dependent dehydrogenase (short-subunit alcohol dehydrogenase family)
VNGGISGLTRTLAAELAPIRVNAIHPGITGDSPYWHGKPPAVLDFHLSRTITKKLATMDDIVDGTRFLLENPSVEGIDLVIDNGRLMF